VVRVGFEISEVLISRIIAGTLDACPELLLVTLATARVLLPDDAWGLVCFFGFPSSSILPTIIGCAGGCDPVHGLL